MATQCGICNEEWAICIENIVQGGEIRLCKEHSQYLINAQHQALSALLFTKEAN